MSSLTSYLSESARLQLGLAKLRAIATDRAQPGGAGWSSLIHTRTPHAEQQRFIDSDAKRKIIRAGRRGGKTTGIAILALQAFMDGKRVLYATPTAEQVDAFWYEITLACAEAI